MTTAYSSLLGLALPVTGELSGTWGDTVNNYITKYLDSAVAGAQTISGTQTAVTLSVTNGSSLTQVGGSGSTGSAQYQIINCTGNPAGLLTITVPAQSKVYLVLNSTSTSQSVKVVGTGPTTGVTIISGEKALIAWNGSDFVKVATAGGSSTFSNVTVTGTTTLSGLTASTALALDASKNVVSVTNTGTGNNVLSASPTLTGTVGAASLTLSSLTSGRVTYAGASGLLQDSANLTFDGTSLTLGGNPTLSAGTANGVLYLNASKVATSGSALTFDGNKLAIAGSSASTNRVDILNDNGNATFRVGYDTGNNLTITRNTGDANIYLNATQSGAAQVWQLAGTEGMRLTSTGLGVGTSSPSQKLHVVGTTLSYATQSQIWDGATGTVTTYRYNGTAIGDIGTGNQTISGGGTGDFALTSRAGNLIFGINTAEKMRLDTAGNLGIGTSSPGSYGKLAVLSGSTANTAYFDTTAASAYSAGSFFSGSTLTLRSGANATGNAIAIRFASSVNGSLEGLFGYVQNASTYGDFVWQGYNGSYSERMRLDSAGNLGIGTTSPQRKIHGYITTGPVARMQTNGSNAAIEYVPGATDGSGTIYNWVVGAQYNVGNAFEITPSTAAGGLTFSTPALLVTSVGSVGIGTSSPAYKLDVNGVINTSADLISQGNNARISLYRSTGINYFDWASGQPLYFSTQTSAGGAGRSTLMTLDSSGNLGLGVTPSGWNSTYKVLNIGDSGLVSSRTNASINNIEIGVNWYRTAGGSFAYKANGYGTNYNQQDGAHAWYTAPSGIAGAAISFTQAMTLDASGRLAIGLTTSTNPVTVAGTANAAYTSAKGIVVNYGSSSTSVVIPIGFSWSSSISTQDPYWGIGFLPQNYSAGSGDLGFYTDGSERARINSGGNFGIGTSSPAEKLQVNGTAVLFQNPSGAFDLKLYQTGRYDGRITVNSSGMEISQRQALSLLFLTSDTERARIDSSGRLLVGTTSSQNSATCTVLSATSVNSVYAAHNSDTSGDNSFIWFGTEAGGTTRGSITYNRGGGVVAYNTTSDYRAKDIIGPVVDPGATIDALKVYMGKMKGATIERPMMIAHEAQAVVSYSVTGEKDAVNEDGTPKYQQMDHQVLVPLLIAELQSLRKRVAQLEGK